MAMIPLTGEVTMEQLRTEFGYSGQVDIGTFYANRYVCRGLGGYDLNSWRGYIHAPCSNPSATLGSISCKVSNYQFYFSMTYTDIPSGGYVEFIWNNNGSGVDGGFCTSGGVDGKFGAFWPSGQTTGTLEGYFVVKDSGGTIVYTGASFSLSYQGFWIYLSTCSSCGSSLSYTKFAPF